MALEVPEKLAIVDLSSAEIVGTRDADVADKEGVVLMLT